SPADSTFVRDASPAGNAAAPPGAWHWPLPDARDGPPAQRVAGARRRRALRVARGWRGWRGGRRFPARAVPPPGAQGWSEAVLGLAGAVAPRAVAPRAHGCGARLLPPADRGDRTHLSVARSVPPIRVRLGLHRPG